MRVWIIALITIISMMAFATESESESTPLALAVKIEASGNVIDATKKDTLEESDIALNLDAEKKAASGDNMIFRILFSVSMVAILGGGAFLFLRKYAVPKAMKSQTQIKVLQQHYLGPKKSLAIIRVAGESMLIGVTDTNISMIKSLSLLDDEIPEETTGTFSKLLGDSQSEPGKVDGEDFSFGGIKDLVSKRLRGMKDFE